MNYFEKTGDNEMISSKKINNNNNNCNSKDNNNFESIFAKKINP